jgi:hypothetical protein
MKINIEIKNEQGEVIFQGPVEAQPEVDNSAILAAQAEARRAARAAVQAARVVQEARAAQDLADHRQFDADAEVQHQKDRAARKAAEAAVEAARLAAAKKIDDEFKANRAAGLQRATARQRIEDGNGK